MTTQGPPKWYLKYEADSLEHGPIPAGILVAPGSDGTPRYRITVDGQLRTFRRHPLTPNGRTEWESLLAKAGEEKGSRAEFAGVAHPPMVYKPSEWMWKKPSSSQALLISALKISGVIVSTKDLNAKENVSAAEKLMETLEELYHPGDRNTLAIFDKEHRYSCWVRQFKRGLVIVGPELNKDRQNWQAFKQCDPTRRSAIRARYSTRYQEEFPPVILGCLPTGPVTVQWFYLEPVEIAKPSFANLWKGCDWASQASRFGYSDTEKFIWAAVLIQRSIVLQAALIRDDKLGDTMRQYGKYITGGGFGIEDFSYKTSDYSSSSPKVTFHELTRWILASGGNSSASRLAKAWDNAMSLLVLQRKSLTVKDWQNVINALSAVEMKK